MSERSPNQTLVKLAAGGTATVWVGTSPAHPDRLLAIKRPHPHLFDDARFLAALQREAAIASRLDHPNVVHMHELVTTGDDVELVMEYVDGLALSDLIRAWDSDRTENTLTSALRIAIDVCAGLEAVHSLAAEDGAPLALVHRDVSPQNVLVSADGTAKIADFGLTRSIAFGDRSTTDGVLKGKAGYLAPEYVRGAPIDRRIDVFALGVVLWEAITKRRLFKGENEADTLQRILKCEIPTLAETKLEENLVRDLDVIFTKALARAPADRFATAAELGAALTALAEQHGLVIDGAAVVASFGPTARAAVNRQRASVVRAREAAKAKAHESITTTAHETATPANAVLAKSEPLKASGARALWLVLLAAVALASGFTIMHAFADKKAAVPIDEEAPPASISSATAAPSAAPTMGFEIIDAVPVAPAESGSAPRVHRPARPNGSEAPVGSAPPPQPRKNPY